MKLKKEMAEKGYSNAKRGPKIKEREKKVVSRGFHGAGDSTRYLYRIKLSGLRICFLYLLVGCHTVMYSLVNKHEYNNEKRTCGQAGPSQPQC